MSQPKRFVSIGSALLAALSFVGPARAEPAAFEARVGVRALHRSFDYDDPLADHDASAQRPFSSEMPLGPAPFFDVGFYPLRWAGISGALDAGVIGGYERLVATQTNVLDRSLDTHAQQYHLGLRARLALGEHELGLSAAFGQQRFYTESLVIDGKQGTLVPNVEYSFVRVAVDARLHFGPVGLGASLGTRFVTDTGPLQADWFPNVGSRVLDLGAFVSYRVWSAGDVLIGVDYTRYSLDFNPVSASSPVIAGGAVDQYLSGYLGLDVHFDAP